MTSNMEKLVKSVNGQINLLRPYTVENDKSNTAYVDMAMGIKANGKVDYKAFKLNDVAKYYPIIQNATALPAESWKALDTAVMGYASNYKTAFKDVESAGLTKSLDKYVKLFVSDKIGSTGDAVKDMDGLSNRRVDTPVFTQDALPLWVTHKDFEISWRDVGSFGLGNYGASLGIEWDETMMQEGVDKIEDMNEYTIFNGYSVPYASNQVYGYCNFTSRNQETLTYDWSSATAAEIYADVKAMWNNTFTDNKQPHADGFLYVYSSVYDRFAEYVDTTYYTKTLRQLCLDLEGLNDIKITDQLPSAKDAVMVRMDAKSVRIIQGTPGIVPVMWYDNPSMQNKLTLLSIQEPQLRADARGYTSITHGNKA